MKKRYNKIENGIEYLVLEDIGYSDLLKCQQGNIKDNDYIKIIIKDGRDETFYFYKNIMHNLYGASWSRLMCKDQYWLYGIQYNIDNWHKIKNNIIRKQKLTQIKKVSNI